MVSSNFTCTSDALYDRHDYEIVLKNGKKLFFNNWSDMQGYWFTNCQIPDFFDFVIIKDKNKEEVKKKGFGTDESYRA